MRYFFRGKRGGLIVFLAAGAVARLDDLVAGGAQHVHDAAADGGFVLDHDDTLIVHGPGLGLNTVAACGLAIRIPERGA